MAANIPQRLKSADIARFATRAAQVQGAKPAVAYWCSYWIVNQILSKGLHTADEECQAYTMGLMDKLEQTKADNPENDAILNDLAGQAYVEQFGLETFQRADNAVRANKASRQTADTFQAAATFLELSHIWGPLDPDIALKVKFAKYHALRIAKALKAGVDPNLSNPTPELSPTQEEPPLDPNDPEVQALNGAANPYRAVPNSSLQPSVQDVEDEHDQIQHRLAYNSVLNESLHSSRDTSVPRPSKQVVPTPPPLSPSVKDFYQSTTNKEADVPSPADRTASIGGGYFPDVPDGYANAHSPVIPEAPSRSPGLSPQVDFPDPSTLPPPSPTSNEGPGPKSLAPHPSQPPSSNSSIAPQYPPPPRQSVSSFPHYHPNAPSLTPSSAAWPSPSPSIPTPGQSIPPPQVRPPTILRQEQFTADDEAIAKAQKHARWAISALNFEDVNTAVKDLRLALQALGAS